jgi:hypothetical protein
MARITRRQFINKTVDEGFAVVVDGASWADWNPTGYIPFEAQAANLFFQLVSSRYERASLIVTSNKPFGRWGEVFGDATVAAAMIDRLVHHAEVVSLKGDSCSKIATSGGCQQTTTPNTPPTRGSIFGR